MSETNPTTSSGRMSARNLLKLPLHERDAILEKQAAEAEMEYRTNPDLTDFEAFDEDDLYGESADSEAG